MRSRACAHALTDGQKHALEVLERKDILRYDYQIWFFKIKKQTIKVPKRIAGMRPKVPSILAVARVNC